MGTGRWRRAVAAALHSAVAVAAVAALAACARQEAPPGGPPDRRPPYVISTRPDTFAVVEPFRDPVIFRFSERISEQAAGGTLEGAVVVSPPTSEVRVEHSRDALEVSLVGGYRAGRVYRVALRPVVRDMFGNTLQRPFELVFSTGPPFHPHTVAGLVEDRITGQPVADARVHAQAVDPGSAEDTVTYASVTDEEGIFTLRYLPPGAYAVTAFDDRNRDRSPDRFETSGRDTARLQGAADTVLLTIPILAADTTPARIAEVEVADSASLRIATDDHLDPARSLDGVRVSVTRDEGAAPGVDSLLHAHEWEARGDRLDSLAAVRAAREAGDTAAAGGGERRAPDAGRPPAPPARQAVRGAGVPREGPPRAEREIYAILDDSLAFEVPYTVEVDGIVNIQGVEGGGGEATVTREAPPVTDTAAVSDTAGGADSTAVADTAPVPAAQAGDPAQGADTTHAADSAQSPDTARPPEPAPPDTGDAGGDPRRPSPPR